MDENVDLPAGYSLVWSGQYEYMEKARKTLNIIIPATLLVIFVLLYIHFGNLIEVVIVMASLPFALLGGFWLIYLPGVQPLRGRGGWLHRPGGAWPRKPASLCWFILMRSSNEDRTRIK